MMNTRKTLKAVKDGVNAAISHPHCKIQGNVYKAAEKVEATSKALRCSSPGMAETKRCNQTIENETALGTDFLSKMNLAYQKKGWNTHFSLPINMSKNHISYTMPHCSTSVSVLPESSEFRSSGIAINALEPRYDKNFHYGSLSEITSHSIKLQMLQQRRMMSTRAVNANRGTIEGIITTLNEKFNADIVNDTQAIYQFNILSGDNREIYYIDLRNGSGSAGKGKSEGSPDTIFSIDAENFNRLVEGNLRAPSAFMSGRMKISGSMQKAAKLEKLFVTLLEK